MANSQRLDPLQGGRYKQIRLLDAHKYFIILPGIAVSEELSVDSMIFDVVVSGSYKRMAIFISMFVCLSVIFVRSSLYKSPVY